MEIFGGFMVMMSIIGLFLAVIWLVMPFVVFAIKGKQDRILEVLEGIEKRLSSLETTLQLANPDASSYKPPEPVTVASDPEIESHEDNIIVSREQSAGPIVAALRPGDVHRKFTQNMETKEDVTARQKGADIRRCKR